MPERQGDESREGAATQTACEEKQDQESPGREQGFSCYSVELLKLLEE